MEKAESRLVAHLRSRERLPEWGVNALVFPEGAEAPREGCRLA